MQILTINNRNFQKPCRNPSNKTKVKILKKIIFGQLIKKISEMFEHRNSGENRRKRSEIFFEHLRRAYKDLIQVEKKFKIISCLCTFKVTKERSRIWIYQSEVRIGGSISGTAPKCHGSPTLPPRMRMDGYVVIKHLTMNSRGGWVCWRLAVWVYCTWSHPKSFYSGHMANVIGVLGLIIRL